MVLRVLLARQSNGNEKDDGAFERLYGIRDICWNSGGQLANGMSHWVDIGALASICRNGCALTEQPVSLSMGSRHLNSRASDIEDETSYIPRFQLQETFLEETRMSDMVQHCLISASSLDSMLRRSALQLYNRKITGQRPSNENPRTELTVLQRLTTP